MKKIFKPGKNLLSFLSLAIVLSACNHLRPCVNLKLFAHFFVMDLIEEPYGATDINAITGNQGLTVAVNKKGTITVFKWPNPSFYDQIKYMTTGREKPEMGALPNEGLFAGLYFQTDSEAGFLWLKEMESEQSYLNEKSVAIRTTYKSNKLGIQIDQIDFVKNDADVFFRNFHLQKLPGSTLKKARIFVYAHFAPTVSKINRLPMQDWCFDDMTSSELLWDSDKDVFIQKKTGVDLSTKKPSSVAIAFGFDKKSLRHYAGTDSACLSKKPKTSILSNDPFFVPQKGELKNSDSFKGKPTAGMSAEIEFNDTGSASISFIISLAENPEKAKKLIDESRKKGFDKALSETERYFEEILENVPLPDTDNQRIKYVALRSIIIILLGYCKDTNAIVASISTQPPYGEDWQRDGAYINEALLTAGFPELVKKHNLFYAKIQSQPENKLFLVPQGNWASNYYADGVPGFPLLYWEIDETGFALWTLYRYYEFSNNKRYLEQVYPAIKRSGDFLLKFRDPETGLTKKAYESDEAKKFASFRGALHAYLGLDFAIKSARAMNDNASIEKWQERKDELEKLILERYYDKACERFIRFEKFRGDCKEGTAGWEHAEILWPIDILENSDPRAEISANWCWNELEPSFLEKRDRGLYEPYGLLSLAKFWKNDAEKMNQIKDALLWEATVPTTDTGLFGEVWLNINGKIVAGQSQPQLWHHALFYLASLEAFGKK